MTTSKRRGFLSLSLLLLLLLLSLLFNKHKETKSDIFQNRISSYIYIHLIDKTLPGAK